MAQQTHVAPTLTVSIDSRKLNASRKTAAAGLIARINGEHSITYTSTATPTHISISRFQKREYSNIQIIQTEKKGFGLRAEVDLPKYVVLQLYLEFH